MANKKQTSSEIASIASKILKDGRYSKSSKSVAGSALSQTKKKYIIYRLGRRSAFSLLSNQHQHIS